MMRFRRLAALFLLSALVSPALGSASAHDGAHDFDFSVGKWTTHIRTRNQEPGKAATWVALTGTVTTRKLWDGGLVEVIDAGVGSGHFLGTTLFLYRPQSHQWTQTYADSSDGTLERTQIGEFADGRGVFVSRYTDHGRAMLDRSVWSNITPNAHDYEIDTSSDGGKTWQPQFKAHKIRIS